MLSSTPALLLNGMAGVDPSDPSGPAAAGKIPADYLSFLKADAIKGKRFGVVRPAPRSSTSRCPPTTIGMRAEFIVLLYEFKDGLNTYLKNSGSPR